MLFLFANFPKIKVLITKNQVGFDTTELVREGKDITIIATGLMVPKAIEAAEILKKDGIEAQVVNIHTIKPLDEDLIVECARKTKKIITFEEANIYGGLGAAVCEVVTDKYPVPVKRIGVQDKFGKSGSSDELLKEYGLTAEHVISAAKEMMKEE